MDKQKEPSFLDSELGQVVTQTSPRMARMFKLVEKIKESVCDMTPEEYMKNVLKDLKAAKSEHERMHILAGAMSAAVIDGDVANHALEIMDKPMLTVV